jgi:ribosomal subunit interface protein
VDIVVKARHVEVSDRFRTAAHEKLAKVERLDPGLHRVDVEVSRELNPRLADRAFRVELTCRGKGPVIRAEAVAMGKLEGRLRRAADRRSDWKKHEKAGALPPAAETPEHLATRDGDVDLWHVPDDGPMIVREKAHEAAPMTLDQALYEMELVGHDFFLFVDQSSGRPSVVYRRRAYDYGVISLDVVATG